MQLESRLICALLCVATVGSAAMAAAQATPTVISATDSPLNNGAALNGIASTSSSLIVTQPYCAGNQTRGIYTENLAAGTSALLSTIPETGVCAENYVAISAGLGGFTAGDTYATGSSTTTSTNTEVFKNGATEFQDGLSSSIEPHAGVVFDTTGTFRNALIVTLEGSVNGYGPTPNAAALFTYNSHSINDLLEGATVAPLTYAPCPGCLFITSVNLSGFGGAIYFVAPGTPSGSTITQWSTYPGLEPEGLVFVGNNLSCTLAGPGGVGYDYFVADFSPESDPSNAIRGAILAFTPAQVTPYVGQFLVPDEQLSVIYAFSAPNTYTVFSNTGGSGSYRLEGSTILPCAAGGGCPATMGFWKHHDFPSSMFVGSTASIGCTSYTSDQLKDILNSNNAGGNAVTILGHQLIAAIANYDAGGKTTPAATAAIASANTLLCANNLHMTTSFVSSSSALGAQLVALSDTLDAYNSSGSSCEGNGLTIGLLLLPAIEAQPAEKKAA